MRADERFELDDDFALAHRGLGQVLLGLKQSEQALDHLTRAAEVSPDDSIVHAGLARVYYALGRPEEARRAGGSARRSSSPVSGCQTPCDSR